MTSVILKLYKNSMEFVEEISQKVVLKYRWKFIFSEFSNVNIQDLVNNQYRNTLGFNVIKVIKVT